jgi:tetratricopeptide (TPR) repeat protein
MNKGRTCFKILALSIVISMLVVIPQQLFAQVQKGIAFYNSREYREAEGALREAIKTEPWNVEARYYLGLSLLQQEKYSDALSEFRKVEDEQAKAEQWAKSAVPNEYQQQMALARARLGLQQYSEAWRNLESAKIENSSNSEVYLYRGIYFVNQKKHQEAAKKLEMAISLDPKNAYAYYYAGLAYADLGTRDKTIGALQTFLKLAPNAPEAPKAKSMIESIR